MSLPTFAARLKTAEISLTEKRPKMTDHSTYIFTPHVLDTHRIGISACRDMLLRIFQTREKNFKLQEVMGGSFGETGEEFVANLKMDPLVFRRFLKEVMLALPYYHEVAYQLIDKYDKLTKGPFRTYNISCFTNQYDRTDGPFDDDSDEDEKKKKKKKKKVVKSAELVVDDDDSDDGIPRYEGVHKNPFARYNNSVISFLRKRPKKTDESFHVFTPKVISTHRDGISICRDLLLKLHRSGEEFKKMGSTGEEFVAHLKTDPEVFKSLMKEILIPLKEYNDVAYELIDKYDIFTKTVFLNYATDCSLHEFDTTDGPFDSDEERDLEARKGVTEREEELMETRPDWRVGDWDYEKCPGRSSLLFQMRKVASTHAYSDEVLRAHVKGIDSVRSALVDHYNKGVDYDASIEEELGVKIEDGEQMIAYVKRGIKQFRNIIRNMLVDLECDPDGIPLMIDIVKKYNSSVRRVFSRYLETTPDELLVPRKTLRQMREDYSSSEGTDDEVQPNHLEEEEEERKEEEEEEEYCPGRSSLLFQMRKVASTHTYSDEVLRAHVDGINSVRDILMEYYAQGVDIEDTLTNAWGVDITTGEELVIFVKRGIKQFRSFICITLLDISDDPTGVPIVIKLVEKYNALVRQVFLHYLENTPDELLAPKKTADQKRDDYSSSEGTDDEVQSEHMKPPHAMEVEPPILLPAQDSTPLKKKKKIPIARLAAAAKAREEEKVLAMERQRQLERYEDDDDDDMIITGESNLRRPSVDDVVYVGREGLTPMYSRRPNKARGGGGQSSSTASATAGPPQQQKKKRATSETGDVVKKKKKAATGGGGDKPTPVKRPKKKKDPVLIDLTLEETIFSEDDEECMVTGYTHAPLPAAAPKKKRSPKKPSWSKEIFAHELHDKIEIGKVEHSQTVRIERIPTGCKIMVITGDKIIMVMELSIAAIKEIAMNYDRYVRGIRNEEFGSMELSDGETRVVLTSTCMLLNKKPPPGADKPIKDDFVVISKKNMMEFKGVLDKLMT